MAEGTAKAEPARWVEHEPGAVSISALAYRAPVTDLIADVDAIRSIIGSRGQADKRVVS